MRREPGFASPEWDDPFWHVVRMLTDQIKAPHPNAAHIEPSQVIPVLERSKSEAAHGLVKYLNGHLDVLERLAAYWNRRHELASYALSMMRTEEVAKDDYRQIANEAAKSYGVQIEGYHKSSKVLVNTVEAIARREQNKYQFGVDTDPQNRATIISESHIWVSPRRLDGAIPGLLNPVALWEIKEYWGKTKGGSKMSDAIYEIQLVGAELRAFESNFGVHVNHYAVIDGFVQWGHRKSDLRRAVDLLYSGLIDELIVGREVITEWPRIINSSFQLVRS